MGELFNSPHEWIPLISERLIDYIRIHISQAGGLTPCRKIALLCELFGVKTAWHGPGDVSPIGHMCNLHLDLASYNFGVQEGGVIRGVEARDFQGLRDFQGRLSLRQRRSRLGHRGGREAGRQVSRSGPDGARGALNGGWGVIRRLDGTVIKQ